MTAKEPMGMLLHKSSKRQVVLAAHSVVGRASGHVVRLMDPVASSDHASLSWTGDCWEVRDLASTNGTSVDGARLATQTRVRIGQGSILRFGADAEEWELCDDRGPVVIAHCSTTGLSLAAEDGILVLPDETAPQVSVLMDVDGMWIVEMSDGSRRLAKDGELVSIEDRTFKLIVPPACPVVGTYKDRPPLCLSALTLRFHVSSDQESVRIDLVCGDDERSLKTRNIYEVLLLLALERQKDAAEARLSDADQGWYDLHDLTRDLAKNEQQVNTMISRIRKVFANEGVEGAEGIVERRPKSLRIGVRHFQGLNA